MAVPRLKSERLITALLASKTMVEAAAKAYDARWENLARPVRSFYRGDKTPVSRAKKVTR